MNEVLLFAIAALKAAPGLIQAGADVVAMLKHSQAAIAAMEAEGRGPTPEEWAALDETINGLMAQLKD